MEEETLSLKQLFQVILKYWKTFFIVILTTIILLTTFFVILNKKSNKNISIVIATANNTNLVDYINNDKYSLIKETLIEYNKNTNISSENLEKENIKLNSSFNISSTNAEELNNASAFKITVKPTINYSDKDLENVLNIFLDKLNTKFVDPNNYLDCLSTYKAEFSFAYDNNKEILENLLDVSANITRLESVINKFEEDFSNVQISEKNSIEYCLAHENLLEIKNQLTKISGSISQPGSIEYNIWQVVENNVSINEKNTYLTNLSLLQQEDTKGIEKQIKNTPDASMFPNEYKSYVTTLNTRFGCEIDIYKNKKNIYEQAIENIKNTDTTQLPDKSLESNIYKNISNFNTQVAKYNFIIDNYNSTDNILEISPIIKENPISYKKIFIYDFIGVFMVASFLYICFFVKLKKQGFFDVKKEQK